MEDRPRAAPVPMIRRTLTRALRRVLRKPAAPEGGRAAARWDEAASSAEFSAETFWLALPHCMARFKEAVAGEPGVDWIEHLHRRWCKAPGDEERILSIGCGTGGLERQLAAINPAARITGIDISPASIEAARKAAEDEGLGDRIRYEASPFAGFDIGEGRWDAVWFISSLHHIDGVEAALERALRALAPGGRILMYEYAGPNRLAFGPRHREAIDAAMLLLPESRRVARGRDHHGEVLRKALVPEPIHVERVDPSEAADSEAILPALRKLARVDFLAEVPGTIAAFALNGIAGNFLADTEEDRRWLDLLLSVEKQLVGSPGIPPCFVVAVAGRRDG